MQAMIDMSRFFAKIHTWQYFGCACGWLNAALNAASEGKHIVSRVDHDDSFDSCYR
jgi:hypothetical protein